MAENSAIEWTDHTFNPWWGCAKVSPGCDNCYAERDSKRYGYSLWGVDGQRRSFGDKHWAEPRKWDRKAQGADRRPRVFCASMADVFDKNAPDGARERLWELIEDTPHLDWLILTKRIGNVHKMAPRRWETVSWPRNVWLGISVVNEEEAYRDIPKLQDVGAHVRFLSCEPLLGPIDLLTRLDSIHWVIVGGESGHKARPMLAEWAFHILFDCEQHGVAFFMKQGSAANWDRFKDFASFPPALQVRQWPVTADFPTEVRT